jgi:transcriptional regulator with XRE-family HTH domain
MTASTARVGAAKGHSADRPAPRSAAHASNRQNRPVGELLREWRERRRLSQLELSIQADVSTRHLSFVETGRSRPTPEMILRLTEQLEVPLRERNALLLAGGYAPAYPEHALDQPELESVRGALRQVLAGHEPFPAVLVNRWWELLEANTAIGVFTADVAPELLAPPANVLRLALHPDGLAPRIVNLPEWRAHLLTQLRQRARSMGDSRLRELYDELLGYPGGLAETPTATDVVLPMRYRHGGQVLSLFSITAVVGTATDVTVDELAIESFYPADAATAAALRELVAISGRARPR